MVAGGDVVAPLLSVPGDRGLGDEPVALHQEGVAPLARAEGVGDRGLDGGDGLAGVEPLLAVDQPVPPGARRCSDTRRRRTPPRPARRAALRLVAAATVATDRPIGCARYDSATSAWHRAGRVADVADPRPDIPERGLGHESGEPAVGRRRGVPPGGPHPAQDGRGSSGPRERPGVFRHPPACWRATVCHSSTPGSRAARAGAPPTGAVTRADVRGHASPVMVAAPSRPALRVSTRSVEPGV